MNIDEFCQAAKDVHPDGKILLITGHACDKLYVAGLVARLESEGLSVNHRADEHRVIEANQALLMPVHAGPRNRWGKLR